MLSYSLKATKCIFMEKDTPGREILVLWVGSSNKMIFRKETPGIRVNEDGNL